MKKITVSKAIREGLLEEMRRDDKMFIMGEDMAVMGNVFAITTGFLDEFGPNRVIDTPTVSYTHLTLPTSGMV